MTVEIGLGIIVWLAIGWLASRPMKYYFVTTYGKTLGSSAWGRKEEIEHAAFSVLGPLNWIVTVAFMWSCIHRETGWGWMW
jgi:hypothetical protein